MLVAGVRLNLVTSTALLPAIGSMGSVAEGREIHGLIFRTNMYNNVFVASALIDMYSKCGCVKHARVVFDTMPSKNIASWKAMIGCYAKHGMVDSSVELLDKMQEENMQPNQVTLTCVRTHGHYACVIDVLCRSGEIEVSYNLIHELGAKVTDSKVGALLKRVCRLQ
uniref:pentatricopeptide repeat-containing protein At3g21470-like n=1 Tax=Erigeron canadensis TaxID=72917 RepID=UPI001CB90C65|nr:pentatricopeptide repeat-containing protein At3g21470-like [Erigeron canadensis]